MSDLAALREQTREGILEQDRQQRFVDEGKLPAESIPEGRRPLPQRVVVLDGLATEASQILAPIIAEAEIRSSDISAENLPLDEASNARAFKNLFIGFVKYVVGIGWRVLDVVRGRWMDDPDRVLVLRLALYVGLLRRARMAYSAAPAKELISFIRASLSYPGARHLLELAAAEPALIAKRSDFDADLDVVLDAKGNQINLKSGEVRRATSEDMHTRALGVAYTPGADCPLFKKFINEAMCGNDDDTRFLMKLSGYGLSGRTSEQKIVIFIGPGANGKGTFSNVYIRILGDYGATADAELLAPTRTRSPEYALAELEGVRFLIVRETRRGATLDEALVKTLTGQDEITARSPYQRPFTYWPQFSPVMETNHAPKILGRDHAIWRRVLRLPWEYRVPDSRRDPNLAEKLMAEAPGILNWMLEGARAWYAEGLGSTSRIVAAVAEYKESTDTLGDFLSDFAKGPTLTAPSGKLYEKYRTWAQESGLSALSAPNFKIAMEERGFPYRRLPSLRFYQGISLDRAELFVASDKSCGACTRESTCKRSPETTVCSDFTPEADE